MVEDIRDWGETNLGINGTRFSCFSFDQGWDYDVGLTRYAITLLSFGEVI